jgi:F420-dependent oxidoreductase-like protein
MRARIFTEPQQGATYDQLLGLARTAEECGFDAFFRSDHYLYIPGVTGGTGEPGSTDAWITLAGLARETSRIRLGTLLSPVTFRLPGPLAISVAQVDAMSGGRVELGLGAGWYDGEHTAYGIPFPPLGERFERLEEQLAIISGLWSTPPGGRFTLQGRHYAFENSPALPKPVQQPHPPIVLGGGGAKRTPRLAAGHADEYNAPFHSAADSKRQFDRVRAACQQLGRDPAGIVLSAAVTVCCGSDEAEVARRAAAVGRDVDELRRNGASGTPAEVAERLRSYGEAGADAVYLQVLDISDLDHVRLLADQVVPHLEG